MNYIGEKIRDLRRKNDYTQEKLADQLGVSYQTVSKWETGVTSPDLSLIVPLARMFRVTTDELFGFNETADHLRKKQLDEAYKETWRSGDLHKRFEISKQAVKEFPDDMEWHDRLAWAQAMRSYEFDAELIQEQEEAIKRFALVIENASSEKTRASSIHGIVVSLSCRDRKEEAKKYAELYPEDHSVSKDDVMLWCLEGEKRTVHYQKMLDSAMLDLLNLIGRDSDTACNAQEQILHVMIPDKNYLYYNCFLTEIFCRRAAFRMEEADYDNAVKMLTQAFYHANEYDRFMDGKASEKSCPFFDKMQWNIKEICKTGPSTKTAVEDMMDYLKNPLFGPLRERDDFLQITGGIPESQ